MAYRNARIIIAIKATARTATSPTIAPLGELLPELLPTVAWSCMRGGGGGGTMRVTGGAVVEMKQDGRIRADEMVSGAAEAMLVGRKMVPVVDMWD